MKSRIKYSSLSLYSGHGERGARRDEKRERERGWVAAGEEGGGGGVEEEDELTRGETRRSKVPCI